MLNPQQITESYEIAQKTIESVFFTTPGGGRRSIAQIEFVLKLVKQAVRENSDFDIATRAKPPRREVSA